MAERTGKVGTRAGQSTEMSSTLAPMNTGDLSWLQRTNRPLRILLAEDTRSFQEIVKSILGHRGHRIELVLNGAEAVDRLRQADFDVVLMDLHMPVMDGLQATAAMRSNANAHRARVPIIAMTAHALQNNRECCLAAAMDDFLPKPFDASALVDVVEWHGNRHNAARTQARDGSRRQCLDSAPVHEIRFDKQAALARLGGDSTRLSQLVSAFRDDVPRQMGTIRAGLQRGDLTTVSRAARQLRDGALGLEARLTSDAAVALEHAAEAGDDESVHAALRVVELELAPLFAAIESMDVPRS
jgi:CheY-like chemotaxis protein